MIRRPSFGRSEPKPIELPGRLAALTEAAELAAGRLDPADVTFATEVVEKANTRLRHGTTHTLVALLGATGSGKSSMANAIAGSDVATTGVRRPTTSSTLALGWGDHDPSSLLAWLDVANRHHVGSGDLDGLVLLDVPDHDSVAVSHRLEMERIAEHADLLLWVTDPEKYADDAMHRYLRALARHEAVTLMVLNKTDRLTPEQLEACVADLDRLLRLDGIDAPVIIAASTLDGHGIKEVRSRLVTAVQQQRAVVDRLSADVGVAADALAAHVDPDANPQISQGQRKQLATDLAAASGVEIVADAAARSYRSQAALRTGWPATRWVRKLRPDPLRRLHLGQGDRGRTSLPEPSGAQRARANAAIREIADSTAEALREPWPTRMRTAATPEPNRLHDQLDLAVSDAVRGQEFTSPRWWGFVGLLQLMLVVTALAGGLWLTALAANNWLQLPEFDTPAIRGIPLPTGLLIIGLAGGWLLALLARRLARIGGNRRGNRVRSLAATSVEAVADELVIEPLRAEIDAMARLQAALERAGAEFDTAPHQASQLA